jgi:UDP-N-acetylmuramate--alanine ligase
MNNIELNSLNKIYFIGIGGIGMSALARYFIGRGCEVHGYDKTETELTKTLATEGMLIHYTDDIKYIPEKVDMVIYTPAVPKHHCELVWFQKNNYPVLKRSEVLGIISRGMKCVAVAGTHGKTTTSSIITHILRVGGVDCTAFLGGISLSLGSNFIQGKSDWVVVEADEYDRSFLRLSPDIAIINSMDADHLDIYGDEKNFIKGFRDFSKKVKSGGQVFKKQGLQLRGGDSAVKWNTYGLKKGDYRSVNVRVKDGFFVFDFKSPDGNITEIKTALPGQHNVENATAAIAVALKLGVKPEKIKEALISFKGIKRRFEYIYLNENQNLTYIDDYAHHPTELNAAITAAKTLYPKRRLTGIFQPHLFTRTRDFQDGFAQALDSLDDCILMDIYPARELPIEGVTSEILFNKMKNKNKILTTKAELMTVLNKKFTPEYLQNRTILTLGAGDIDTFVEPIKMLLNK